MEDEIREIHQFWFGEIAGDWCVEDRYDLWWYEASDVDAEIERRFRRPHAMAAAGELPDWGQTPRGRLALIILLDQFSRNIFRRRQEAFANDALARSLCIEGIDAVQDAELRLIERVFFYMPLMHSECSDDQDRALRLYSEILAATTLEDKPKAERYVGAAELHKALIDRFGRFPHRNKVLRRDSTDREAAYLSGEHEAFGQG